MSEQPKWTPGPWKCADSGDTVWIRILAVLAKARGEALGHLWWIIAKGKRILVAEVLGSTREADARLIAAAPELYEALEVLIAMCSTNCYPEWLDVMRQANAVLAKARGEA